MSIHDVVKVPLGDVTQKETTDTEKAGQLAVSEMRQQQFEEQCFLIDNWHAINKTKKVLENRGTKTYGYLSQIYGSAPDVINQLTRREQMERFLVATPAELACLVPKIRLFKVVWNKSRTQSAKFEFDFPQHVPQSDIQSIVSKGSGRLERSGAGIKSFTYEHHATNPAEQNVIYANITLYFQSMAALLSEWQPPNDGDADLNDVICKTVSYFDIIRYAKKCNTNSGAPNLSEPPSDQKCGKGGSGAKSSDSKVSGQHFEVRAVIGWAFKTDMLTTIDPKRGADLAEAANMSGYILNLGLKQHTLNFKETGEIELETEWIGGIEATLQSPEMDIFWADPKVKKEDKKEADVETAEELAKRSAAADAELKAAEANYNAKCAKKSWPWECKADDPARVRFDKAKEAGHGTKGANILERDKRYKESFSQAKQMNRRYNDFIDYFQRSVQGIYYIDIDKHLIEAKPGESGVDRASFGRMSEGDLEAKIGVVVDPEQIIENVASEIPPASTDKPTTPQEVEVNKELTSTQGGVDSATGATGVASGGSGEAAPGGTLRVHFFYYSDLVNAGLGAVGGSGIRAKALANFNVALGPIMFNDPRNPSVVFEHNMGDTPISLNLFFRWWYETVIKPVLPRFPLREFLARTSTELLAKALGKDCIASKAQGLGGAVRMSLLTGPVLKSGEPQVQRNQNYTTTKGSGAGLNALRSTDAKPITIIPASNWMMEHLARKDVTSTLFMYIRSWRPRFVTGDEAADRGRGIYHLALGTDRGIVKKIEFKRSDQPHLREARIEAEGDLGGTELRDRYEASVTLVGTSWWVPGQMIYLSPASMGLGGTLLATKIGRTIGVVGYYTIIKVEGILEDGKYETLLHCKWETSGDCLPAVVTKADVDEANRVASLGTPKETGVYQVAYIANRLAEIKQQKEALEKFLKELEPIKSEGCCKSSPCLRQTCEEKKARMDHIKRNKIWPSRDIIASLEAELKELGYYADDGTSVDKTTAEKLKEFETLTAAQRAKQAEKEKLAKQANAKRQKYLDYLKKKIGEDTDLDKDGKPDWSEMAFGTEAGLKLVKKYNEENEESLKTYDEHAEEKAKEQEAADKKPVIVPGDKM